MAAYYVWSGAAGANNGTSWANAYTTLSGALSGKAAGSDFYVAHDHVEAAASSSLTSTGTRLNPNKVICVDRAGTVPPVTADKRTTAQISTSGTNALNFAGFALYDGMIFTAGSGASSGANMVFGTSTGHSLRFDNCSLRFGITAGIGSRLKVGGSSGFDAGLETDLNNTTLSFATINDGVEVQGALIWRNTPAALIGAAVPTTLFTPMASAGGAWVDLVGIDLSAAGAGKTIFAGSANSGHTTFRASDCKLHASVTKSSVPAASAMSVDFVRSGASGNYAFHCQRVSGLLIEETTIVRTSGGATDGITPLSWKVATTTNCTFVLPFETPPIAIWNDTIGTPVTATVECIGAAIPTDKEVWLMLEYLSDATAPQGAFVSDGADILATAANQTSSSETWGGSTAAFKLAATFTAQKKGWIYARVRIGKASSTFYIDPLVTLT